MASSRSAELEEIWALFAQESRDNLAHAEESLLALEQDSSDMEQVKTLFRAVHSFKGGVRMMGLSVSESLAHRAEDLIALVRDDGVSLQSEMVDVLLAVLDRLRGALDHILIEAQDVEQGQVQDLVDRITQMIARLKPQAPPPPASEPAAAPPASVPVAADDAAPIAPVTADDAAPNAPVTASEFFVSEPGVAESEIPTVAPVTASDFFLSEPGVPEGEMERVAPVTDSDFFVSEPGVAESATVPESAEPGAGPAGSSAASADLSGFLRVAESALSRIHGALDAVAGGNADGRREIQAAAAVLKQAAEPFGYQRVIGVLDDLSRQAQTEGAPEERDANLVALQKLEMALFEELTRVQDTFASPENMAQPGWTDIAWLFRHWNADKVFADLTRLSQIAQTLDRDALSYPAQEGVPRPVEILCEEAAIHLRSIYHSGIFYHLDRAVHLTLSLEDLYRRVGQGELKFNSSLPHLTQAYVMNLGSAIDAIREGEEPELAGLQELIDQTQDFIYLRADQRAARDILDVLDLPPGFREVMTPEALAQLERGLQEGERFYTVLADMQRNETLGDAFVAWAHAQSIHLITNITVYRYRRTLFNFLLSTELPRETLLQSLSELDPEWQYLTLRECAVRAGARPERAPVAAPAAAPPVPEAAVYAPAGAGISAEAVDSVLEALGEMVAEHATLHRVLARWDDADLRQAIVRLFKESGANRTDSAGQLERLLDQWTDPYRVLNQVDSAMSTALGRMQDATRALNVAPAREIVQPLEAIVSQLAATLDKQIELVTEGGDLELDRGAVQALADPIRELVRFAATQGIEDGPGRRAAGKSATGHIAVRIDPHQDHVQVQVQDDGRGLDRELIRRRVREHGLSQAGATADQELALALDPKFGALGEGDAAVDLGRISSDLQARHARLSVTSTPGQGSVFQIRFPLDRAVVDGMVVRVGEVFYVVPVATIRKIVKADAVKLVHSSAEGSQTFLLDGDDMVPVRTLAGRGHQAVDAGLWMIVEDQDRQQAVPIDELIGRQQVLVRPLQGQFKDIADASACALLGEGRVGLVLRQGS